MKDLEAAWSWRQERGVFQEKDACRVFHGPGEGSRDLQSYAIDRFCERANGRNYDHYWITRWERGGAAADREIVAFLKAQGAHSIVELVRQGQGETQSLKTHFGNPPSDRFSVSEGTLRFKIQFHNSNHPGLFLDHEPLRKWILWRVKGMRVLNTFCYTGSLSVAAGKGGASRVTSLDLSKATLKWAEENLKENGITDSEIVAGDFFEVLPRFKRDKRSFDCVILDPPSFSRAKAGNFSTAKDLERLHELAFDVMAENGLLITSINSANVTWRKFETDVLSASRKKKKKVSILSRIDLPETFPTRLGDESSRYLKGWILKIE